MKISWAHGSKVFPLFRQVIVRVMCIQVCSIVNAIVVHVKVWNSAYEVIRRCVSYRMHSTIQGCDCDE